MGLTIRRKVAWISLPALAVLATLLPAATQAATINVPATGSTASIQAAVDAASPGDTIVVAPGIYTGPTVNVEKDGITIRGLEGRDDQRRRQRLRDHGRSPGPGRRRADHARVRDGEPELQGARLHARRHDDPRCGRDRHLPDERRRLSRHRRELHRQRRVRDLPALLARRGIDKNSGGGGEDATIYVGVDDNVLVEGNTSRTAYRHRARGHREYDRPQQQSDRQRGRHLHHRAARTAADLDRPALIEGNVVNKNNLTNPFPPACDDRTASRPAASRSSRTFSSCPPGPGSSTSAVTTSRSATTSQTITTPSASAPRSTRSRATRPPARSSPATRPAERQVAGSPLDRLRRPRLPRRSDQRQLLHEQRSQDRGLPVRAAALLLSRARRGAPSGGGAPQRTRRAASGAALLCSP